MTQREALDLTVEIIKDYEEKVLGKETNTTQEIISMLLKMKSSAKMINWSKDLVFEVLNEWRDKHGRNPSATDLVEAGMPSSTVIKKVFDMKSSAFLKIYYPREKNKKATTKYSLFTNEDWASIFVEQYEKHKPVTSKEYDTLRDKDTPTWITIARNLNLTRWRELIEYTKVDCNIRESTPIKKEIFIVNSNAPLYEKLAELIELNSSDKN